MKRITIIAILVLLTTIVAQGQIKIGGSVYGGGNAGDLTGNTSVTVYAGDLNNVYGGARMADVGGNAFVNVDGEHASDYIIINKVYGGNDIAGTIGQTENASLKVLPAASLKLAGENGIDNTWDACLRISTKTTTDSEGKVVEAADAKKIYIGQLFGGGNGAYDYNTGSYQGLKVPELAKTYLEICGGSIVYAYGGGNEATVTEKTVICVDNPSKVVNHILVNDNGEEANAEGYTTYATSGTLEGYHELLTNDRFKNQMGINLGFSYPSSDAFQIGRLFGGNNVAPMAILPKWNLKSGSIRNLYSGGNEGSMTSPTGILLEIAEDSKIKVDNVYGGCRKADVRPIAYNPDSDVYEDVDHVSSPQGYNFPADLAARLLVRGGDINNVYGGNDISGKVYFGNAVGVYTSIRGDVYGGGNGSYPYTDCEYLENDETYGDLYYKPADDATSVEALNAFRPNAEQVSLRLVGKADKPTIIGGSVYVGGNSATLKKKAGAKSHLAELKIGSYVIADRVFLGNNGKNMVVSDNETDALRMFARKVTSEGVLVPEDGTAGADDKPFNSMTLVGTGNVFDQYMDGCAMDLLPTVVFDSKVKGDPEDYIPYTSYFGSFYCGGNVGSMTGSGTTTIDFTHKIVIYDKLVGGCNSAFVPATDYNAAYEGGVIGSVDERASFEDDGGNIKNRIILNLANLKIEPKRWAVERDANYEPVLTNGEVTYLLSEAVNDDPTTRHRYLEWNTVDSREYDTATKTYKEMRPVTSGAGGESTEADLARRLFGGNIYGGCCESGIVNGNVVINLDASLEERSRLFDEVQSNELGEEESLYGNEQTSETNYYITQRNTGVILGQQGMDVFGSALNVFGGGKGKSTEIWGSTVINLNRGYTFQIFGGSEEGVIGKPVDSTTLNDYALNDYVYNSSTGRYAFNGKLFEKNDKYSCYVNLCGTKAGVSKAADTSEDMAECEFMYGGGFFGPIAGNTVVNMGNGRIFNSFGGSCNGDILGVAETFMGRQVKDAYKIERPSNVVDQDVFEPGFTWVRDMVYGANDLGGRILGENDYKSRVRGERQTDTQYSFNVIGKVHNTDADSDGTPDVLQASAYVEYLQGRADAIFGGCYGTYDYKDRKFARYTEQDGDPLSFTTDTDGDGKNDPLFFKPRLNNAFVNFRPTYYNDNNVVKSVYGAGQGESGEKERDLLQNRSYVLIDIPQISNDQFENFNKYSHMEVFGAGAWGGVGMNYTYEQTSTDGFNLDKASAIIDLVRGEIGAAYGGSLSEGVTRRTVVNVPSGSTIKIGSIFGGAYGKDTYLPCDVIEAHVEYHSADAVLVNDRPRVENNVALGNPIMLGAIYGGNNNQRRTIYGIINIDVPVWQEHYHYGMTKANVYGAGYGSRTWNEYTQVNLNRGAEVFEVYGGGEAGGVMSAESVEKYVKEFKPNIAENTPMPDEDWRVAWTLGSGYDPTDFDLAATTPKFEYVNNLATNLANPIVRTAEMDDRSTKTYKYNTNVIINEGAYVGNYAYGGGYGKEDDKFAGSGDVYGTTYIALLGGTVNKDIYAAGTSGAVYDLFGVGAYDATSNPKGFTASANAYIKGGTVRNVYGGGWRGSVGYHKGAIGVVENNVSDQLGEAHVVIGAADGTSHVSGIPSVTRNVYGGGEGGAIFGDAYVTMYKGYVGYRYKNTAAEDATPKYEYVPELDDVTAGDNKLELGGNIFGGGYVANSYVDDTHVTMWDGVVRGSLYGGGEIGPVGRGTVRTDSLTKYSQYKKHNYGFEGCQPAAIYKPGSTQLYLWGGHVRRNVFGGGRGYDNWNGEGFFKDEDEKNNMDRSSKGYVFGSTDVHIRGGEIGTEEGMLKGYGNVFGGGNEGFVYSGTGVKKGTDRSDERLTNGKPTDGGGFYYEDGDINKNLSLDCNITVEPYCKVKDGHSITIGSTTYTAGEYVPVEDLNKLKNRNNDKEQWEHLNIDGVTIHNAIFAGGNITEGSDNLFANTTTVYGNAAASLRDVYNFDLISLGTDDMGGLYGDGNLTLVNGFRELHIDNYGTDYYSLDDNLRIDEYNELTERQKAYYKLKYVTSSSHPFDYYECKELHTYEVKEDDVVVSSTAYKRGQKISEAEFNAFPNDPDGERKYWTKGTKTYEKDDQIEEGEYILMYAAEQANWVLYGVTSIYAGRPMNTIQRADMCGVFGSRMVLRGAEDRVVNTIDYHAYTINRVDEVSLNKRTSVAGDTESGKDGVHGNYFGIYSEVNYLGNLTSDVFFDDIRKTDSDIDANKADGATYYEWKSAKPQAKNRNNGISHNKVALASGVFLEIKREEGEILGEDEWGYITGVVELDLINVMQGMGGGYVYARNEHGRKTYHSDWGKVTLLDYNNEARTYRRFTYTNKNDESNLQQIETSGNFVHNVKQIVDDCYPNGGIYKDGYTKSPAHYWFIRGQIYVYDQYISAFTGSANAYAEKVEMPLTISAASNGRMTLREVQPNYYAYYDKNGNKLGDTSVNADDKIIVNNETYHLNDPVSYWAYRLMSDAEKARFVEETYVVIDTCKVNDVLHLKGEVLLPSEYNTLKNAAHTVTYEEGDEWKSDAEHGFDYFFRPSNNLSSATGYVLTYDVNNPMVWNNYYTKTTSPGQEYALNTTEYAEGKKGTTTINKADYTEGPTYTPKSGQTAVYAQQEYKYGDIVFARTKQNYDNNVKSHIGYTAIPNGETLTPGKTYYTSNTGTDQIIAEGTEVSNGSNYYTNGQAMVKEQAYIVTKEYSVKDDVTGAEVQHLSVGTPIYRSKYTDAQWTDITTTTNSAEEAKVCTTLLDFSATDYVYAGQLMTAAQVEALNAKVIAKNDYKDDPAGTTGGKTAVQKAEAFLNSVFDDAYYCTEEGLYGGSYFEAGKAYSALETWCSMTADEREHFDFNYDALDLLVDPTYDRNEAFEYVEDNYGYKPKYDGYNHDGTKSSDRALTEKVYSATKPIDYQAEFAGYKDQSGNIVNSVSYTDEKNQTVTIAKNSDEASWLTREQYEDIPNEKHHYSPITVTAPGNYYVVKNVFMRGDIPYTTGQVIDETSYLSMTQNQRANIDVFNFTESMTNGKKKNDQGEYVLDKDGNNVYDPIYYFYCRDSYKVNEKGMGVDVTTTAIEKNGESVSQATTYGTNADVPQGIIIDQGAYDDLKNFQQGFIIHGLSPTETSTLYVSAESDIHDLSTEKIITVIYLYEYEESDESGLNVMPVSERHIVNIHINFKSGVPEIGDIQKPDIVLPGTTIGMNIPTVSQGAYRVTESGWELFENESDARTHTNGQTYYNNETPVYWYQNNYWIAYYAQTYLGKTYSNSVPISVANYHDLAKVMGDPQHHYYIDHKDAGYEPKIYINDYSEDATPKNGLDLFKDLMELTHGKTVTGHNPLSLDNPGKPIRNAQYLEFFLRADQDHGPTTKPDPANAGQTITEDHPWTPIANENGECFSGVLHGDGHTISGLSSSLFNHLCGRVYNLGVTGSFTGAGVAETGEGYVENCWVKTTGTPTKKTTEETVTHYAVFGNPSREGTDLVQVVNCYYPSSNDYDVPSSDTHGVPTQKPDKAFYNGEVAYDLNGFYLNKRFYDNNSSWPGTKKPYSYWRANADGTLPETMTAANYPADYAFYPLTGVSGQTDLYGYVEDRFVDGDFIYAGGTIPTSPNERLYVDPDTKEGSYHAIWPDDYLFFGQALSYGHMDGKNGHDLRTHQDLPAVINKAEERVLTTMAGNRVFRAPAYFRSKKMGVAHFNPYAVLVAEEKLTAEQIADNVKPREAYKNMTAIDFTGSNGDLKHGYEQGSDTSSPYADITGGAFFPPLLDDGGLQGLYADLTRNLLAYTMTSTDAARQTDHVVANYLHDEQYVETAKAPANSTYSDTYRYHTVAERDAEADAIRGHRVQKQAEDVFVALNDHVLIDKQDFNAPISYTFADGQRMWYQRKPDNYVDIEWIDHDNNETTPLVRTTKGWEGISLPFKVEIVTTNEKGELTHFYQKSNDDDTNHNVGHEYWLRDYRGGNVSASNTKVFEATFNYPDALRADGDKDYTNTFLWDYYYSHNNYDDQNGDDYQENDANRDYYKYAHTFYDYPRMAAAMPYIIGLPSERFYEFDLSGNFEAATAMNVYPKQLEVQTLTFASKPGDTTIGVSDDETGVAADSYRFKPSYLNESFAAGTTGVYTLNTDGNSYQVIAAAAGSGADPVPDTKVYAFRPYFVAANGLTRGIEQIVFGNGSLEMKGVEEHGDPTKEELNGGLHIYTRKGKIYVKSSLSFTEDLRVVTPAGVAVATLTVKPGQTVEVQADFSGMYIVHTLDGLYTRKVAVKRE